MNPNRFDSLSKALAGRFSRRSALKRGSTGLAATALLTVGGHAVATSAQEASPEATPATPPAGSGQPSFLFVQSFQSGSFAAKPGEPESFTLTLDQGPGYTVYFADRPDRTYGALPTQRFIEVLDFGPANPPNAALVLQQGTAEETVVVLELLNPTYDESTHTATYDVIVLTEYEHIGATFQQEPIGREALPAQFGQAHLFIDNATLSGGMQCCPTSVECIIGDQFYSVPKSVGWLSNVPHCSGCSIIYCQPCQSPDPLCNATFPECNGQCHGRAQCSHNFGFSC